MQQLDHHSLQLMRIFRRKGGAAGKKIKNIMADLDKDDAIETKRACVLKALVVYLNEDPETLIKEYIVSLFFFLHLLSTHLIFENVSNVYIFRRVYKQMNGTKNF
ncbi:hypothetical protein ILYODFUR_030756, partial [Ilyodon furcidens]